MSSVKDDQIQFDHTKKNGYRIRLELQFLYLDKTAAHICGQSDPQTAAIEKKIM